MHVRKKHLLLAMTIFIVEVLIAAKFSHVKIVRHFLGDFLVVMLIYHFLKFFCDVPPFTLAMSVFLFACSVELLQYLQFIDLLGVRRGTLLSIIIGTSFSWLDILMYFLGCLTSCGIDACFFVKLSPRSAYGE